MSNLPSVWSVNRKLLHQRIEGKEVSQEENFLPKHERVKDLCQRTEYQTPCQQTGQVTQTYCNPYHPSPDLHSHHSLHIHSLILYIKNIKKNSFLMVNMTRCSRAFPSQTFCFCRRVLSKEMFFWNKCRKTEMAPAVINRREKEQSRTERDLC